MVDLDNQMVGAGIALGAGIGATGAILLEESMAMGAGYGVAAGIILGTLLARLAPRLAAVDRPELAILGVGIVVGSVVGGLIGTLAAWSVDESLVTGLGTGALGGGALGVILSGIVIARLNRSVR